MRLWAYAATMAGTLSLANFHVLPLSAVDIAPPVVPYSQSPLCLKDRSAWLRVSDTFSQPVNVSATIQGGQSRVAMTYCELVRLYKAQMHTRPRCRRSFRAVQRWLRHGIQACR